MLDNTSTASDQPEQNELTEESPFWVNLVSDDIGQEIVNRSNTFLGILEQRGLIESWVKRLDYYYGHYSAFPTRWYEGLKYGGQQGQYVLYHVNHFGSLVKSILNLATVNPPQFDIGTTNTDSDANETANLANTILDYYLRHKKIRTLLNRAAEHSLLFDAGYLLVEWDTDAGRDFVGVPGDGYDGDVRVTCPFPVDVAFDPLCPAWEDQQWVIVRQRQPRAAAWEDYPEYRSEIESASSQYDYRLQRFMDAAQLFSLGHEDISDDIVIYKFFHRRTSYLPEGRLVYCLEDGTVLRDEALPYASLPVERMIASEHTCSTWGRSPIVDLIAPQEALNVLNTSILTNQWNFAIQFVSVEAGTRFDKSMLDRGMVLLEHAPDAHPPQGLNLTSTPAEVFNYRAAVISDMETIANVSAVSRGQTPTNIQAGAAFAFTASMTAQGQGPFLSNYNEFAGNVATALIRLLKAFANNPRTIAIMGKYASGKTQFTKADLMEIDLVHCDIGNPMLHSFLGRQQAAQAMAESGLIDANQYLTVLKTGNLDDGTEGRFEEENEMRKENEWLMAGRQVIVMPYDNHQAHLMTHRKILNLWQFRLNTAPDPQSAQQLQTIINNVLAHMAQHEQAISQAQVQQQMAAMGGQPGQPPAGPAPAGPPGQPSATPGHGPVVASVPRQPRVARGAARPLVRPDQQNNSAPNDPAVEAIQAAGSGMPRQPSMPTPNPSPSRKVGI